MIAGDDLLRFEHGDHVDARSTDAHRYKPGPGTRVQIRYLVMHDLAARFPKRLTRNDLSRLITLELEEDFALEYVTEYRSGMAMRPQSFVRRRELDELRHRMRAFGNPGRGDAQKVSDLGVSCNQHVFYASPDLAVVLGHFGAANRRQLPPSPHAAVGSTPAALPTMRSAWARHSRSPDRRD